MEVGIPFPTLVGFQIKKQSGNPQKLYINSMFLISLSTRPNSDPSHKSRCAVAHLISSAGANLFA